MSWPWDVLAIPSRGRSSTIVGHTLKALQDSGCRLVDVEVWVPADEADAYMHAVQGESGVLIRPYHVDGPLTIRVARNLIADAYDPGTELVCADDDVRAFLRLAVGTELRTADLNKVVPVLKGVADLYDGTLWGVYPVANGYFMNRRITTDLRLIVGTFFGYTVKRDPDTEHVSLPQKEDSERTIHFYQRYGAVVRAEHVCIKADFYTQPGGIQLYRTPQSQQQAAFDLHRLYPGFTHAPRLEKSGQWETRLKPTSKGEVFDTSGRMISGRKK